MSDTLMIGRNSAALDGPDFEALPLSSRSLCEYGPLGFDAGDANLYRYVGNDPTDEVDPDGLKAKPVSSEQFRTLLDVVNALPIGAPTSTNDYGRNFEKVVLKILNNANGYNKYPNSNPANLTSSRRTNKSQAVLPEVVTDTTVKITMMENGPALLMSLLTEYHAPNSYFIEIKRLDGNDITLSDTDREVDGYLDYLGTHSPAAKARLAAETGKLNPKNPQVVAAKNSYPILQFITTSDTTIAPSVIAEANRLKVVIVQSYLEFDNCDQTWSISAPIVRTTFNMGGTVIINKSSPHYKISKQDVYPQ